MLKIQLPLDHADQPKLGNFGVVSERDKNALPMLLATYAERSTAKFQASQLTSESARAYPRYVAVDLTQCYTLDGAI